MTERDPSGKSANQPGAKLDAGKAPVMRGVVGYFPRALEAVALVSAFGAEKYTWGGWRDVQDGFDRYSDAMGRHFLAEASEGRIDAATGLEHAAQVAWNALARLELQLSNLNVRQLGSEPRRSGKRESFPLRGGDQKSPPRQRSRKGKR